MHIYHTKNNSENIVYVSHFYLLTGCEMKLTNVVLLSNILTLCYILGTRKSQLDKTEYGMASQTSK
jgi:hypothetical protein